MFILASNSPRRKEILSKFQIQFQVIPSNYNESDLTIPKDIKEYPRLLSYHKALDVFNTHQNDIVLGSDTIVVIDNEILGKPKNKEDGFRMLKLLSNKTHYVITGVTILSKEINESFVDIASVTFNDLSDDDINDYLSIDEYKDKAGAYAIQGIGSRLIKEINGDYYTIMGLPYEKLTKVLKEYNII